MEKRLEAGWFQRIAWSVLVWFSLGLLVWVPFLYVAIRRGRGSDWGAFAAFMVYEVATVTGLSVLPDDGDSSAVLGIVIILCLLTRRRCCCSPCSTGGCRGRPFPTGRLRWRRHRNSPYGYPYGR